MIGQKGQALIETVAFFMALSGLLVCLLGFTQYFTVRQKILIATREAALLYSSGRVKPEEAQAIVQRYLTTGTPAFDARGLKIEMGRDRGILARFYSLDRITVSYTIQSRWIQELGLNPTMEETCIIKHAPHYGPLLQTFWGPPVPY